MCRPQGKYEGHLLIGDVTFLYIVIKFKCSHINSASQIQHPCADIHLPRAASRCSESAKSYHRPWCLLLIPERTDDSVKFAGRSHGGPDTESTLRLYQAVCNAKGPRPAPQVRKGKGLTNLNVQPCIMAAFPPGSPVRFFEAGCRCEYAVPYCEEQQLDPN